MLAISVVIEITAVWHGSTNKTENDLLLETNLVPSIKAWTMAVCDAGVMQQVRLPILIKFWLGDGSP
jgi:hypothetical protein